MSSQWLSEAGLDLFEATQVFDKDGTHPATLCILLDSSDLEIWFIEEARMSLLSLTDAQFKEKCRLQSVTPVEFLRAVRETFASRSGRYAKQSGKIELSFSSSSSGKLKLDIPSDEPDAAAVRSLLVQFGKQHADLKREKLQLKRQADEMEERAKTSGAHMAFVAPDRHRAAKKKPKIQPGMSLVNPRNRAIKQPKGVVFGDDDTE